MKISIMNDCSVNAKCNVVKDSCMNSKLLI